MESFEAFNKVPTPAIEEFQYEEDLHVCRVKLPDNTVLEFINTSLEEPNVRDSYVRGFCPSRNAMGQVHIIEENGALSVKKVTVDDEVLFEAPTIH